MGPEHELEAPSNEGARKYHISQKIDNQTHTPERIAAGGSGIYLYIPKIVPLVCNSDLALRNCAGKALSKGAKTRGRHVTVLYAHEYTRFVSDDSNGKGGKEGISNRTYG